MIRDIGETDGVLVLAGKCYTREDFEKAYGSFNQFPPKFKRMSQKEFAQSMFFQYDPTYTEYRQAFKDDSEPTSKMTALHMFYFHDGSGIAMVHDYWKGKVSYYSFCLCEHEFVHTKNLGNCYNEYTCKKCGLRNEVDSSD